MTAPVETMGATDVFAQRTSNTEEDEVHQRASLVLQMANSLESSNNRRKRQLQQIASGRTDNIKQMIEDIMYEKPANLMDLLKEAEPEALPSKAELEERYKKKAQEDDNKTDDEDEEEDEDEDDVGKTDEEEEEEEEEEDSDDDEEDKEQEFNKEQDSIMAEATAAPPIDSNIPPETLQAHTAPLQDQLKRSYAAIVKLRENSDLRYQALEKKYLELKREKQFNPDAFNGGEVSSSSLFRENSEGATNKEQVNLAYEAIVRLKENADLRYNVLESKFLDLKRSKAESDSRNERLEMDLEAMRMELLRVLNDPDASVSLNDSILSPSSRRATFGGIGNSSISSFKFDSKSSKRGAHKTNRKRHKEEKKKRREANQRRLEAKKKSDKQERLFLQEFQLLCDKVEDCEECCDHVPQTTLRKAQQSLSQIMDGSYRAAEYEALLEESEESEEIEEESDSDGHADNESEEEDDDDDDDGEEDTLAVSFSSKRHDGAMALLGANWDKISKIDERKLDQKPGGRFANLSESKSEKNLRGKKSQFVAAQSGVYCRIDHDMQNQYGDLDQFEAPSKPTPPPPPPSVRHTPPQLTAGEVAVAAAPAMKASLHAVAQGIPAEIDTESEGKDRIVEAPEPMATPAMKASPHAVAQGIPAEIDTESEVVEAPTPEPVEKEPELSSSSKVAQTVEVDLDIDVGVNEDVEFDDFDVDDASANSPPRFVVEEEIQSGKTPAKTSIREPKEENTRPSRGVELDDFDVDDASANSPPRFEIKEEIQSGKAPAKSAIREPKVKNTRRSRGMPYKAVSFSGEPPVELEAPVGHAQEKLSVNDSSTQSPKQLFVPASPGEGRAARFMDESEQSSSSRRSTNSVTSTQCSLEGRVKRIPPAKLDAAERKAKREAALKESKAAAKSIRKKQKSSKKTPAESEDSSVISGLSNVSSVVDNGKSQKSKGLFKNPFRKKNKSSDGPDVKARIPKEIIEEPPQKPKASRRQSSTKKTAAVSAPTKTASKSRRQSAPPVAASPVGKVLVAAPVKERAPKKKAPTNAAAVEC